MQFLIIISLLLSFSLTGDGYVRNKNESAKNFVTRNFLTDSTGEIKASLHPVLEIAFGNPGDKKKIVFFMYNANGDFPEGFVLFETEGNYELFSLGVFSACEGDEILSVFTDDINGDSVKDLFVTTMSLCGVYNEGLGPGHREEYYSYVFIQKKVNGKFINEMEEIKEVNGKKFDISGSNTASEVKRKVTEFKATFKNKK